MLVPFFAFIWLIKRNWLISSEKYVYDIMNEITKTRIRINQVPPDTRIYCRCRRQRHNLWHFIHTENLSNMHHSTGQHKEWEKNTVLALCYNSFNPSNDENGQHGTFFFTIEQVYRHHFHHTSGFFQDKLTTEVAN